MPHRSYRRVSPQVRKAAVEQVVALTDKLRSESEACRVVAEQIGVHTNSVRNWVRAAEGPSAAHDTTAGRSVPSPTAGRAERGACAGAAGPVTVSTA